MKFMDMMKKAQELQSKMQDMQEQLESLEVSGSAGGGLVVVTLSGKGAMRGVKIDPSLADKDEMEVLEDLVVAAHNDAKTKLEQELQDKMSEVTGGMGMPPGMGNLFS